MREDSLVKNAADEDQVKYAGDRETKERKQELADIRAVMSTREGRRFLWRYLGICGIDKTSAETSGSWTYFNEGRKLVGLTLKHDIVQASPEGWIEMQIEVLKETLKENKGDENVRR